MPLHRSSSALAVVLLALTVAGCKKKETPTPDPIASAALPPATATATATATASASASAAPAPATEVIQVRVPLPHEGEVVYLKIKHPNAHAAEVLNRDFKAAADKRVDEGKTTAAPGVRFQTACQGGFPTEDVFWERCDVGAFREGARCPWSVIFDRVWSLAGAEPARIDLKAQMTGDWIAVVDASCQDEFQDENNPWTTFDAMFDMNDGKPSWRPEKDGLVLSTPLPGNCNATRSNECKVPWDRLASFVKPGSLLKPIADKGPPGPKLALLEDSSPPPPPDKPARRPGGLPEELGAAQVACDGGDWRACVKVAEALFSGDAAPQDQGLARWMFWKACDAGEPTGCVNLGWSYLNDGSSSEAAKDAAPYFGKACTDKVVIGCLGLGTIYRDGRSTPKNPARAAELFKRACDGGVKAACAMAKAVKP